MTTDAKTAVEKLRFLLPHWIEHNRNHAAEFRKWASAARAEGAEGVAGLLEETAARMVAADELLKKAEADVGGPDEGHDHHHHHHD